MRYAPRCGGKKQAHFYITRSEDMSMRVFNFIGCVFRMNPVKSSLVQLTDGPLTQQVAILVSTAGPHLLIRAQKDQARSGRVTSQSEVGKPQEMASFFVQLQTGGLIFLFGLACSFFGPLVGGRS